MNCDEINTNSEIQRPNTLALEAYKNMDVDERQTIEIIDLCTPISDNDNLQETKTMIPQFTSTPKSFQEQYSNVGRRWSILACYPAKKYMECGEPLLANIPPYRLTPQQLTLRRLGTFQSAFHVIDHNSMIPSFLREKYTMFFSDLLERLKVDLSILDYNYTRLNKYMTLLAYEQMQVFNMSIDDVAKIDEKEYPLALEFYLQFDVNMFYMKTCSIFYARPRTMNEGLFCLQEPEARYELSACGNCGLCYPKYDMTYRTKKSILDLSPAHKHTFVNGYQAILNCSASCFTQNIVYVLTCPCNQYDYVGATSQSLHDRLIKHRQHGNRIMREFLLGQVNILRDLPRGKSAEVCAKDRMKLYQHSVRCPVAMQMFLDANPQYWRFIPMTIEESMKPEQQSIQGLVFLEDIDWALRSKEDCRICVEAIPKPPDGYAFSNRQIVLQMLYFQKNRDKVLPIQDIDLYNASIVAVLPEICSDMFRYTIESLFITHAETKLNTLGNVLNENPTANNYPLNNPWLIRGNDWCQGLLRRPQPRFASTTERTTSK